MSTTQFFRTAVCSKRTSSQSHAVVTYFEYKLDTTWRTCLLVPGLCACEWFTCIHVLTYTFLSFVYSHLSLDKDNQHSSCLRHNFPTLPYAVKGQTHSPMKLSHIVSTSWTLHGANFYLIREVRVQVPCLYIGSRMLSADPGGQASRLNLLRSTRLA